MHATDIYDIEVVRLSRKNWLLIGRNIDSSFITVPRSYTKEEDARAAARTFLRGNFPGAKVWNGDTPEVDAQEGEQT